MVPGEKIEWCWLQLDNAAIMLQEYRQSPPTEKLGEGVSICFICEDALAIYNHIISNGLPASEPFVGNNMWVVGVIDPDGYKIFFESPTDVPEETMYSDWIKTNRVNQISGSTRVSIATYCVRWPFDTRTATFQQAQRDTFRTVTASALAALPQCWPKRVIIKVPILMHLTLPHTLSF